MADTKTAFVTGWPVNHSRSPLIHNHWLKRHGLSGEYVKYPCEPENFGDFLSNLEQHGYVGGNVTVPHKETAHALVQSMDPESRRLGAINTVWLNNGQLQGTNTDGYGFLANLDQQCPGWDSETNRILGALLLGAGGASRAIINALADRGFSKITIANRTLEKAEKLARHFGGPCCATSMAGLSAKSCRAAIIVNTTSLGMNDGASPLDLTGFPQSTIVNDIVYTPLITPLLAQAEHLGMRVADGLGMLLHQAVPGFEKWFGVRPVVDEELRNLILADLGETGLESPK